MIPFVWQDYDIDNTYNIDPWQRVQTFEELEERILELRDEEVLNQKLEEYRNNYSKVLLTEDQYFAEFSDRMNELEMVKLP
jgi:hypothetical protein